MEGTALADTFHQKINTFFFPIAKILSNIVFYQITFFGVQAPVVVLYLVVAAIFFTLYLGFINIRKLKLAVKITRGDYADPKSHGEISHFQALCTAISGTVGIGNIGGIPIAIAMGGPGAVFWMIIAGFLGMSTKFVECTLATKFRRENPDGSVSGGPMYYLEQGFKMRGFPKFGKGIGMFYAAGIVIACMGIGNMFQSNQAFMQFLVITGGRNSFFADKAWLFGLIFSALIFCIIVGGIKSIAKVVDKMVPFMAGLYLLIAITVVLLNWAYIGDALRLIVTTAFNPQAVGGGVLGVMLIGFQRAIFSNEAGIGSAAIAHSAVKTDEPVTEGFVALLEPFIDTIIIQTITALVVVTTMIAVPEFANSGLQGMQMSSAAFARHFAFAPYLLAFAGMLFAVSTALAWSYYGVKGVTYLAGETKKGTLIFNVVFCVFFAFGAVLSLDAIMDISDALVFLVCVPNIIGLFMLAPIVKKEMVVFLKKMKDNKIKNYRVEARQKTGGQ
ncbi:MAG: alanine:cation symporter family protein [Desulfobacteraceae bacterium]|nr:alanine:cation symporter family protein [Desulfobacteraceae bacterium]